MEYIVLNRELFRQAGVELPDDDWTVEDLLQKAEQLTRDLDGDGRIDQYGFRGAIDPAAFGAEVIAADGSRALCNSQEMIECLQFNLDLVYRWRVSPLPEEVAQEGLDAYMVFRQGKVAMMRMFTWNLPFLRERCADVDWDIVSSPRARQRGRWASSQAVLVSADTAHPEEAWLLCREFFSPEFQRAMAMRGLPPDLRVAEAVLRENTSRPENLAALYRGRDSLVPTPRIPNVHELKSHYDNAVASVFARRSEPAAAMARAERAINRTIERRRR